MASSGHNLRDGQALSFKIVKLSAAGELEATVSKVSDQEIVLKLITPKPGLLEEGERLRLRFWDEEGEYYCDADLKQVVSDEEVRIVPVGEAITLQRRTKGRRREAIPFSFTVVNASNSRLASEAVHKSETKDIGLSGLSFESKLPLKEGDQILVFVSLIPPEKLSAASRVVSSTRQGQSAG